MIGADPRDAQRLVSFLRRFICGLFVLDDPQRRIGSAKLRYSYNRPRGTGKPENKAPAMAVVKDCSVDEEFDFTVQPVDRVGDPVPLPAGTALAWATDNDEITELALSEDTLTCTVRANGVGVANVTCRFDGDPSEVEQIIVAQGVVNCGAGKIAQAELSAGDTRPRAA
jgi:hypothetical protein